MEKEKISESELRRRNEVFIELLRPHKTIRDPIYGDVTVTKLETNLIDTKDFQRLHKIKQLGTAYLVYPGAMHSRFNHAIGTLYMAQYLFELALKNPFKVPFVPIYFDSFDFSVHYPSSANLSTALITNYHLLLVRICALLHDLAHIPFGHTLEDEGFLFKPQWDDEDRVQHFLGDDSVAGRIIIDTFNKHNLNGKLFLKQIREILKAKNEEMVNNLPYPFVADIISNTICADLLDYVARDVYFCGLNEAYDKRFLRYFYITLYNGKPRLVLRLIKPTTGQIKRDVFSETLHLLRLRYSLAEKVYYHHAKISASAMIISATASALKNGVISKNSLLSMGEDEFLTLLKNDDIGNYIIGKLEERKLYKPVYKLGYTEPKLEDFVYKRKKEITEEFKDWKRRYERERDLEKMNMLRPGQVVIYCPGAEMGQKAANILVDYGIRIGPLNKIEDERKRSEIESSVVKKHLELWSLYVFVDPCLDKTTKLNIASDCAKEIFHLTNEIENEEYRIDRPNYLDRFKECAEEELKIAIPKIKHREICERYRSREPFFKVIAYEEYLSLLKEV